jgi:YggT family protein
MNAVVFLVPAIFDIFLSVLILRVLLQLVRANFYNPISQLIWKLTQPVVGPPARYVPRWRTLDIAGLLVLLAASLLSVWLLHLMLPEVFIVSGWPMALELALLMVVNLTAKVYVLSLFAEAVLSWVGPGTGNPNAAVLWSLNEPLLRPVRRILPPVSGLDLSPIPVMIVLFMLLRVLAAYLGNLS